MSEPCKQFILEQSLAPVSGCVTVALPSITPFGMAVRVAVTTTSFLLVTMDIIPGYQDKYLSQVFDNPVRGGMDALGHAFDSCVTDA
jgi:hypothetical protein